MPNLRFLLISFAFISLISCKTSQPNQSAAPKVGMFKVEILYPSGDDKTFDMDYYEKNHMPMMAGFIGKNLYYYEIDKCLSGRSSTDKAPFVAIGYFYIKDVAEYNKVVGENITAIRADLPKYTNIQPTVVISEIKQLAIGNKQ